MKVLCVGKEKSVYHDHAEKKEITRNLESEKMSRKWKRLHRPNSRKEVCFARESFLRCGFISPSEVRLTRKEAGASRLNRTDIYLLWVILLAVGG